MRAPLVVAVLVLAAGIAAGAQRSVPPGYGPFALAMALAGAGAAAVLARPRRRPGRPGRFGRRGRPGQEGEREPPTPAGQLPASVGAGRAVLAVLFAAGLLLGAMARTGADRSCTAWLPDLPLGVEGRIHAVSGDRLELDAAVVEIAGVRVPCHARLPARLDGPAPEPGAAVTGRGRWWRPPGTGGLRPFGLLLLDGLEPVADSAGPDRSGPGTSERTGPRPPPLARVRAGARSRIDTLFGDRAPLAASLLLAQRDGLDRDVRDRFARAGLSHLLAISGLHVGLVAGILLLLTGVLRLRRAPGAGVAAGGTLAYVLFLGAPHSALRAALQIGMVLAARAAQRAARTEAMVAAAALVLLAIDPAALFSPGFQLSFAGVAGILALRRPLLRTLERPAGLQAPGRPVGRWLADGLATSIAATVATAPIVAWHFGRVAPVGIVANLVAIPLLSAAVPALALALAVGLVSVPGGRFLAGAGGLLLDGIDATARTAAAVPGGTVAVPASVAVVLTGAVVAGYAASRRIGRSRGSVRATVWAGAAVAILLVAPLRPTADRVELHVIDVGQGDAIGIRSPAGRWLLVDAGVATDSWDAGARLVVPYLARRGVQRLEGLVITHPDADHMGGAGAVLSTLGPRWVMDPGQAAPKDGYLALLRQAAGAGVPWLAAVQGMELDIDGMRLEVLHPGGGPAPEDANDASVVIRVVYGEFQALLTGDASTVVEVALARRYDRRLEADVLKVGHHGSNTSTSGELLAATGAELALISAGRDNRYGHPHRAVLERLAEAGLRVVRTDRHGTIVVRGTSSGALSISTAAGALPP